MELLYISILLFIVINKVLVNWNLQCALKIVFVEFSLKHLL